MTLIFSGPASSRMTSNSVFASAGAAAAAAGAAAAIRKSIHEETMADLADCGLGVVFAAAAILFVISLLGRHSLMAGAAALTPYLSSS